MERCGRRRRIRPNLDAEQHIKLKTDKAGLKEHFINPYKGQGVFATEVIKNGDFVFEYCGKLLKQEPSYHTKKYYNTEEVFLFDFQWKENNWCLDASEEDSSLGRLVNDDHQNPNCKMKMIAVEWMPHLCLFALKDIEPREEITYSYGDGAWPWRKKKSATEVRKKDGDTTQSRMTKLRRHLEECMSRHRSAEEQRNSKEKQQTKILMQREKLVKKLAELDKHLNSPPDDATEGPSWYDNTQKKLIYRIWITPVMSRNLFIWLKRKEKEHNRAIWYQMGTAMILQRLHLQLLPVVFLNMATKATQSVSGKTLRYVQLKDT